MCIRDRTWARDLRFDGKTGLDALFARSEANLEAVADFVAANDWIDFLAADPSTRSSTSICLKVTADWFGKLDADPQGAFCKKVVATLASEGVAYDCAPYRDAPPGFRFWGGPTVDPADTACALQWLKWAYETHRP